MVDEIFDRTYQSGRADLNAGIDRLVHRLAAIGDPRQSAWSLLHRVEWMRPAARIRRTAMRLTPDAPCEERGPARTARPRTSAEPARAASRLRLVQLNCAGGGSPIAPASPPSAGVKRRHGPPPPDLRRQGQDPLRGSGARHADPIFQGRRDRVQRPEARHDQRQGRAQQPHFRAYLHRAAGDRRPDPLHPPPQHARAVDPPGRDRADRGRRPQRRRGLAVEAPRDRGRHPAAAHDHRILLQGRRARRPADRRRAYRLLRLGQPGRDERHRRHGDPRERLHVRHVRRRSASA